MAIYIRSLTYAMPAVVVHMVVGDDGTVAVVVGVKPVAIVVVHMVAAPVTPLVAVRVVSEVQVRDLRVSDVAPHADLVHDFQIGEVLAEPSDLVRDPVAFRRAVAQV